MTYKWDDSKTREFVMMALRHGMVLVPREATQSMLVAGEGITDFFLPDAVGPNTKERRMQEMAGAWSEMIKQWEIEVAMMIRRDMVKEFGALREPTP